MKLGISLTVALGKEDTLPSVDEKSIGDLYIELVKKTAGIAKKLELNIVELVSFPPFDAQALQSRSEEIQDILEQFEVLYHLPAWEINPAALNKEIREVAIKEQENLIDFAVSIDAKQLCMHPASFGAMQWVYGWFLKDIQRNSKEAINRISRYAQERSIPLNIENLPYKSIYFTQPNDFKEYLNDDVGMVLDTSHAFTAGVDPVEFLQAYTKHIKEIHVVDGFNQHEDTHSPLGDGEIDFKNLFNELEKSKFDGPVVIEMMSEEDALKSISYLRGIGVIK